MKLFSFFYGCVLFGSALLPLPSAAQVDEAVDKLKSIKNAVKDELKIEPIDYEKLKSVLPKRFKGLKRTDLFGERASAFGLKISYARAEYRGKKGGRVRIKVTDTGNVRKLAATAMAAWLTADIQRRSDDGFERTFEYQGHRAFAKYSKSKEAGELKVLVADRFLVEIEGKGVEMETVTAAMKKIKIKKLVKWRDQGVEK
ncbi:MAG: hypothetical protein ONA69_03940 [candidate division KSB1 bacterium]|nr:hypothetical protein [candidate division KSB1 bacterium]MDZ7345924.1 hypothetical protein [candidate division KSB1 bacterium]